LEDHMELLSPSIYIYIERERERERESCIENKRCLKDEVSSKKETEDMAASFVRLPQDQNYLTVEGRKTCLSFGGLITLFLCKGFSTSSAG